MTQPLPWEKNATVPVPPAPEPVPFDAYTALLRYLQELLLMYVHCIDEHIVDLKVCYNPGSLSFHQRTSR